LQDRAVASRANTDGAAAGDQSSTGRSRWCASNLVANVKCLDTTVFFLFLDY
jgi:hypothetical protein